MTCRTLLVLLTFLASTMLGFAAPPRLPLVSAQGASFDCPPPASLGATPAAPIDSAARPAAYPIAFPEGGGELTVFAAASLTDAFERIAADLTVANPNLSITFNFAGSQALVTQLNEGAEADVFASANEAQMLAATENGAITDAPTTFVRNRLAIVVPSDNPAGIVVPANLGNGGVRLVLAQAEVPVGRYSRESVCLMGRDVASVGAEFAARVAANVVSEEEDVRDVLTKVQLGEADAGIVYVSDVSAASDEVILIQIPDAANIVATYPIAAVAGGDTILAHAFIGYVLSAEGQATLAALGFEPVA